MSNNNLNNVLNNNKNDNGYRSIRRQLQTNQIPKVPTNFTSIKPFEVNDNLTTGGFRGGNVLVDRYNGSDFLSNPFDTFPKLMSSSLLGQSSNLITPLDDINKFGGKSLPGTKNVPKIIVPVPIYSNIIDEDSIDTYCHLSKVVVQVIQQTLAKLLEKIFIDNEITIDFQVSKKNQYEFSGRVFTNSLSDFFIKIYKLKHKDNKGNISVVEIRKVCGDEFGYYKFEELLLKELKNKKILLEQHGTSNMFGSPLSMDFGSLTLDDEDDEIDNISEFSDNDIVSIPENDDDFDCNLCQVMLETLYSKDSYREEYMHDAYQLSTCLKKNDNRSKNMINYIVKNEANKLIQNILEPITSNKLFCAFIIVHVLESLIVLLSRKDIKSKLTVPKTFQNDIKNIYKMWSNSNGIQNNLGSISVQFTRSQQIERRCESILTLIQ